MTDTNQRGYKVGIVGEYPEPTESDAPDTIKVQVVHTLTGDTWSGELKWCGLDEDIRAASGQYERLSMGEEDE